MYRIVAGIALPILILFLPTPANTQQSSCAAIEATNLLLENHPDRKAAFLESNRTYDKGDDAFEGLNITIPVVFHIMYSIPNGAENIADSQVISQLDVLNEDYGRYGSGYNDHEDGCDTKIQFCMATLDPNGLPTTGIDRVYYPNTFTYDYTVDDSAMKTPVSWDVTRYMNIYVVGNIGGFGAMTNGFAYFPAGAAGTALDGVVLDYRQTGREGQFVFNLGRTGTHEVGHYLNLHHPWGQDPGSCCDEDDYVDDTPGVCGPRWDCTEIFECNSQRQLTNYMDYTPDYCKNLFTTGQAYRMWYSIAKYRPRFLEAENLLTTGCESAMDSIPATGELFIFPNPAEDNVVIYYDFDSSETADIMIMDGLGKVVRSWNGLMIERGGTVLNLEGLEGAIYLVSVRTELRYLLGRFRRFISYD